MRSFWTVLITVINVTFILYGTLASTIPPPYGELDDGTETLAQAETTAEMVTEGPVEASEFGSELSIDQNPIAVDPTETVVNKTIPAKTVEDVSTELPEETWITTNQGEAYRPNPAVTEGSEDEASTSQWRRTQRNVMQEPTQDTMLEERESHSVAKLLSKLKPLLGLRAKSHHNYTYATVLKSPCGSLYIPGPSTRTLRQHFITLLGFMNELLREKSSLMKINRVYDSPLSEYLAMDQPDERGSSSPQWSEHSGNQAEFAPDVRGVLKPEDLFYTTKYPFFTITATAPKETNPLVTEDQLNLGDKANNATTVIGGEEAGDALTSESEDIGSTPEAEKEEESETSI